MVMSDIEGKALRERVTELGSEGIQLRVKKLQRCALSGAVADPESR
jgi:hypothetical protein